MIAPSRPFVLLAVIVLLPHLVSAAGEKDEQRTLTIPHVCSVGTPGAGWTWTAVSAFDPAKGGIYVCKSEGSPGRIILQIDPAKHVTDDDRIKALKVDFNLLHQSLEKLGCTDIKGKRPDLKTPIPTDVSYFVFGNTPKGASVYFQAHTIFLDHTFLIYAAAPSLKQSVGLAEIARTLKQP